MTRAGGRPGNRIALEWWRLKRSLDRRWREWRLPHGFERLGSKYGGWWLYAPAVGKDPLLIDCGLGRDISFPIAFLERFGGRVVGIDPNPDALEYCRRHCPRGMEVQPAAFWTQAGESVTFYLPRPAAALPKGADGVSGSLLASHPYASERSVTVSTTSLAEVLARAGREECDALKLDIEGAEYEVLAALCKSGEIRRAVQVLVEFHHGHVERSAQETRDAIAQVESCGFSLCHTEGRNAHFLRRDARHAG